MFTSELDVRKAMLPLPHWTVLQERATVLPAGRRNSHQMTPPPLEETMHKVPNMTFRLQPRCKRKIFFAAFGANFWDT